MTNKKSSDNSSTEDNEAEQKKCELKLVAEEQVSKKSGFYVLSLSGSQSSTDWRIAAGFSNSCSAVYSVGESFTKVVSLDGNDSPIVGLQFSTCNKNILYTATRNTTITACDLRAKGKVIATIKDSPPEGHVRPLSSFAISNDDRLVVAGTEHVGGDAFILFWDLRYNQGKTEGKSDLLGGYWESHMDDVTALSFNPEHVDTLSSGSTDGLINIFDLRKSNEDSALKHSLNTESSVDRIGWLRNGNIWCMTHTHELQIWDCEEAEPSTKFKRNAIENMMHSPSDDTGYLVNMHNKSIRGQPFFIAGTNVSGNLNGLGIEDGKLVKYYDFVGNKQLVRDSWHHETSGCLVTGGEGGCLNLWKPSETTDVDNLSKSLMKIVGKKRDKTSARVKPY